MCDQELKDQEPLDQTQLQRLVAGLVRQELENENSNKRNESLKKGKPLGDYVATIDYFTSTASTVFRSLALGGIGIIWIFKKDDTTHTIQQHILNEPLLLLVISMGLDMLQYFLGGIAWKLFFERKYSIWKKRNFDENYGKDITAPNVISTPLYILWIAKIVVAFVAYWKIFSFLSEKL